VELVGAVAIDATGNAGGNKLTGNSADNVLDGGGGADTLSGGSGTTPTIVDAGDQIIDTDGVDLVKSDLTFSLVSLGLIENLTLTGSSNINATGMTLTMSLTGNAGAKQLFGGRATTPTSWMPATKWWKLPTVVRLGEDRSDFSLAALAFVENLNVDRYVGRRCDRQRPEQRLTGNDGVNRLDGSVGNDTMIGGKGDDTYVADAAATSSVSRSRWVAAPTWSKAPSASRWRLSPTWRT
jgi:Ca2+-binding RTX toxin-like protein